MKALGLSTEEDLATRMQAYILWMMRDFPSSNYKKLKYC